MSTPLEVFDVVLSPGQQRTISVDYPLSSWRIYSSTRQWQSGTIAVLPGTSLSGSAIQMIPGMKIRLPAIGQYLTCKNLSTVSVALVIEVR